MASLPSPTNSLTAAGPADDTIPSATSTETPGAADRSCAIDDLPCYSGWEPSPAPTRPLTMTTRAPAQLSISRGLQPQLAANEQLHDRAAQMLDENVTFTVTARTRSGQRIQDLRGLDTTGANAHGALRLSDRAKTQVPERLQQEGCEILRVNRYSITVRAPARLVADLLGQPLQLSALRARSMRTRSLRAFDEVDAAIGPQQLFFAPPTSLSAAPRPVHPLIDHFVFMPPPVQFAPPQAQPPVPDYHHLTPERVRQLLRVPAEATADEETIAIIDGGLWPEHPHFAADKYKISAIPVPGGAQAGSDLDGHGTAICRNVFMVCPSVQVLGLSYLPAPGSVGVLAESALEIAAEHGAGVISCSWGWDYEQAFPTLQTTIQDLVASGHIVLFAAGNGARSWPASMPEVIAIGGVYADPDGHLEASDYASGFRSDRYPNRLVPDVSGLCGQQPSGVYIPMPCPPGSHSDQSMAGNYPHGDGTSDNDGWCVMSGTSSATPQVASVIALMLARARSMGITLTPERVRQILHSSAQSVQAGHNAFGFPATGVPNAATGFGLVDAQAALSMV